MPKKNNEYLTVLPKSVGRLGEEPPYTGPHSGIMNISLRPAGSPLPGLSWPAGQKEYL